MNYLAMHICQTEIAAAVAEGQLLMIQPHQMQNRGMQIVNVDFLLNRSKAEFVRCSVGHSALHAATG